MSTYDYDPQTNPAYYQKTRGLGQKGKDQFRKSVRGQEQLTINYGGSGTITSTTTPDAYSLKQPYTTTTLTYNEVATAAAPTRGTAAIQALHDILKTIREAESYSDQMCDDCAQGNEWVDKEALYAAIKGVIKQSGAISL